MNYCYNLITHNHLEFLLDYILSISITSTNQVNFVDLEDNIVNTHNKVYNIRY